MSRNVSKANCAPRKLVAGMKVVILVTKESIFYDLLDAEQGGTWVNGVVDHTSNYGICVEIRVKWPNTPVFVLQEPERPKQIYIVRKVATK